MRDAHVLMSGKLRDLVIPCQRHPVTENRFNLDMETIGDRIRKRRKELGLTQGEVAKRAGLGTGTISDLENGRQRETTQSVPLAQGLGVRPEWLTKGVLPMIATEGVREVDFAQAAASSSVHGIIVSREGARVGAEWDKIEGEEFKQLAKSLIYSMVAAQKRAARQADQHLTTRTKTPKNKHPRASGH